MMKILVRSALDVHTALWARGLGFVARYVGLPGKAHAAGRAWENRNSRGRSLTRYK